ncbi:MAG: TadE family protein [Microbacterium sp.]|nr:MAG: TadE family protein [Microbacterium sp.]
MCIRDDRGSAAVEFVLVGVLLTGLTLIILQVGLAVYVRHLVHDAAVEGAYHAALADVSLDEGAERARAVVDRTIGDGFVSAAHARESNRLGEPTVEVTVVATMPLVGLIGIPSAWEVTAHAPDSRLP